MIATAAEFSLTVLSRRELTASVCELTFGAESGAALPAWEPGAHVDLRLPGGLVRQYSLVPSEPGTWAVAVLREEQGRGGSLWIHTHLLPGVTVTGVGPRIHFQLNSAAEIRFVAGGIGVTPLLAMCAAAESRGVAWSLDYLGHSRESMAYLDELLSAYPGKIRTHIAGEQPRLDITSTLRTLSPTTHVYCCGPERLMDEVEDVLGQLGRVDCIHVERFQPRSDRTFAQAQEFTVLASRSNVEFTVPADESILMAADFEGIEIDGDCMEGTCGTCETRVIDGEVEHRDSVLSPAQQARSETMMICVSRAAPSCTRLVLDL